MIEEDEMAEVIHDYYTLIYKPEHPRAEGDGWVPEQYLVMEEHLGREVSPDESVRHINGDTRDNRIENLQVVVPQFASRPSSLYDNLEAAQNLSRTFVPCQFQNECWKTIRGPLARKLKVYLPYRCSYQSEGDIYKCGHYWKFLKAKQEAAKVEVEKGE